jgi:uncharacterized membrane protein YesL
MTAAVRVGIRTFRDAWDALVQLALLNLLWLALSLTIVLMPPATVAMFEATHELAHGRLVSVAEYLGAVRRRFGPACGWGLLNLAVGTLLAVNVVFYDRPEPWAAAIRSLFLVAALVWTVAQLLVWPYVFEQADHSLRRAVRNALLTVVAAPGFSIVLGGIVALLVVASVALLVPLATITTALLCLMGNHAVLDRLVVFGKRAPLAPDPDSLQPSAERGQSVDV